jgi:hypothetical protein
LKYKEGKLLVHRSPPEMWYAPLIGKEITYFPELTDEYYWSRENAGYLNIIRKQDATPIGEANG